MQQDDNVEQVVVVRKSADGAFFEHDGVQFDGVVCQDIDPQVPEDNTEFSIINTISYNTMQPQHTIRTLGGCSTRGWRRPGGEPI